MDDRSKRRLNTVHPMLRAVMLRAYELYTAKYPNQSFIITEGVRTIERQKELYDSGASKTMDSRHLAGSDGRAKACDAAVKLGSEVRWDGSLYIDLAEIVAEAASELDVAVRWGGAWVEIAKGMDLGAAQADYAARCRKAGKRPLIDGPHFELSKRVFP